MFDKYTPARNSGEMLTQEETWLLCEKHHGQKTADFLTDCQRLKDGEPLAYVIGYITFLNCLIWLDSRPLIPRVETEYGIEQLIKEIKKADPASPLRILDLCAGSGCIGVAIAKSIPNATVDFIELDSAHISTIKKNCRTNKLPEEQTRIMAGNLFLNLNPEDGYDYIISNPPYIDPLHDRAEISVKSFEPHLALYGGTAGLEIISNIIKTAPDYLKKKGWLWLEHEPEQSQTIQSLSDSAFIVTTLMDQYHAERFSRLVLK